PAQQPRPAARRPRSARTRAGRVRRIRTSVQLLDGLVTVNDMLILSIVSIHASHPLRSRACSGRELFLLPRAPLYQRGFTRRPSPDRQSGDAVAKFGQGDDAQENLILIAPGQPFDEARVGARPDQFGYDIGVEQEAHRSTLRSPPLIRSIFTPDRRSGDLAKN